MFKSVDMQKYIKENNLEFQDRIDFDEMFISFSKLKNLVNFTGQTERINFLINSLKCWLQHFYRPCNSKLNNGENKEIIIKLEKIISTIIYIFNIEWKEGLLTTQKNCLIFNVKESLNN